MKKIVISVVVPLLVLSCVIWYGGNAAEKDQRGGAAVTTATLRAQNLAAAKPLTVVVSEVPQREPDMVVTEYKSEESEAFLWKCLKKYSPNDVISAGIMGYFWRESFFRSDAVSGWATILGETGIDISVRLTATVDEGLADGSTKEMFIYVIREESGGYGLGQWFSIGYLDTLYDFAQAWGTSLGDAEMQCAFVVESMKANTELWDALLQTDDPETAGELIAIYYDGTSVGVGYIGDMAVEFYDKHHEAEDAQSVAA